jgi:CheY-like chemotaxis protein
VREPLGFAEELPHVDLVLSELFKKTSSELRHRTDLWTPSRQEGFARREPKVDLNFPKVDGRTVLATIKTDTSLMDIPVIVLTCSGNPKGVEYAYRHQAAGCVTKPADLDQYFTVVRKGMLRLLKALPESNKSAADHY